MEFDYFTLNEEEGKELIKQLSALGVEFDYETIWNDDDEEIGYAILPEGRFDVMYDRKETK